MHFRFEFSDAPYSTTGLFAGISDGTKHTASANKQQTREQGFKTDGASQFIEPRQSGRQLMFGRRALN